MLKLFECVGRSRVEIDVNQTLFDLKQEVSIAWSIPWTILDKGEEKESSNKSFVLN